MSKKEFPLKGHEIVPIATGYGGCICSDRITVDGATVGFMYRDEPMYEADSGWCFLAGDEDEAYMDDSKKHGIYDVNTIANYAPGIIAYLDAPTGSRFVLDEEEGGYRLLPDDE